MAPIVAIGKICLKSQVLQVAGQKKACDLQHLGFKAVTCDLRPVDLRLFFII